MIGFGDATHESDRVLRAPRAESGSVSPFGDTQAELVTSSLARRRESEFSPKAELRV